MANDQEHNTRIDFTAAVAGAGVMGSGIAGQCAESNVQVTLKDISLQACERGLQQIKSRLDRQLASNRISQLAFDRQLACINLSTDWSGFDEVHIAIEAIVENPQLKQQVLRELEGNLNDSAILASNTSTISIEYLAGGLKRPENFCGLHFFNPVAQMKLVEVVRSTHSSDTCIDQCVEFAKRLGKVPVVVRDCPGFLVNRLLFPYFHGFDLLVKGGVSYQRIDRVMTDFGWPMGPAYLADVIGMDVMVSADTVLCQGYPGRMRYQEPSVFERLYEKRCLGQKAGKGFYTHLNNLQGRVSIEANPEVIEQLYDDSGLTSTQADISDLNIIERMMLPMCTEALLCLKEGVVPTAKDIDLAVNLGLGFPTVHTGLMHYLDALIQRGLSNVLEPYQHLGPLYQLTD